MLLAASSQCVEQAVALCAQLGPAGPIVFTVLGLALAAFERWNAKRKLEAERAETARKLAEHKAEAAMQAEAAAAALARVKAERNQYAARAQELEVKIASIRPPPMPSSSSSGSDHPPVELVGGDGDTE